MSTFQYIFWTDIIFQDSYSPVLSSGFSPRWNECNELALDQMNQESQFGDEDWGNNVSQYLQLIGINQLLRAMHRQISQITPATAIIH